MVYLKAVILAVVEGITEFLPISSTGHLIILDRFVRLSPDRRFADAFTVMIQLPAILAVVLYFWSELWPFRGDRSHKEAAALLWARVVLAFLPAAVFGLAFEGLIKRHLFSVTPVALALIIGGIVLIAVERMRLPPRIATSREIGFMTAAGIGAFQCLSLFPGVSRSAATIIGAMVLGASRPAAAEFAFFLAVPTMLGAAVFEAFSMGASLTMAQWSVIGVGSAVSFLVAYCVVASFMRYIRQHDFTIFGYYRIVLGLIVLALSLIPVI